MKKFISTLLAAPLLLVACSPSQSSKYTIHGTFENAKDGDSVILEKMISSRNVVKVDTVVVKEGAFTFEGVVDTTCMYGVSLHNANAKKGAFAQFMMETGTIDINVPADGHARIKGTPLNLELQALMDSISTVNQKLRPLISILRDRNAPKAQRDSAGALYEEVSKHMTDIFVSTVERNINNPLGLTFFEEQYLMFKEDVISRILKLVKAPNTERKGIQKIEEHISRLSKVAKGKPFIDFALATPEGKEIKLSDFAGKNKLVLVDFWASWCGPCRQEMPTLVEAYKKYHKKGLEIVGVSFDDNAERWKGAIDQLNITWPQMSDLKGWKCEAGQLYGVRSIPHTVLINAEGIIIEKNLRGEELLEKLEEILK
jgi:peroxiredoxin